MHPKVDECATAVILEPLSRQVGFGELLLMFYFLLNWFFVGCTKNFEQQMESDACIIL